MFRSAMFAVLAALVVLPVMAETAYVDDTLRVGVRRNANSSEAPLAVVTSGARLEVLERGERYWRVRTDDGVEGWVSASYVTTQPPVRVQVEQLKAENARLKAELQARDAPHDIAAEFAVLQRDYQQLLERFALTVETEATTEVKRQGQSTSYLGWFVGLLFVVLAGLGFALGKRHERSRVMRRFNGLRL